jgi:hypothetical protein
MHDMSMTPDYAHLVVKFNYDPLDAGGVSEAKKVVPRPRDAKGRFVSTIFGEVNE